MKSTFLGNVAVSSYSFLASWQLSSKSALMTTLLLIAFAALPNVSCCCYSTRTIYCGLNCSYLGVVSEASMVDFLSPVVCYICWAIKSFWVGTVTLRFFFYRISVSSFYFDWLFTLSLFVSLSTIKVSSTFSKVKSPLKSFFFFFSSSLKNFICEVLDLGCMIELDFLIRFHSIALTSRVSG